LAFKQASKQVQLVYCFLQVKLRINLLVGGKTPNSTNFISLLNKGQNKHSLTCINYLLEWNQSQKQGIKILRTNSNCEALNFNPSIATWHCSQLLKQDVHIRVSDKQSNTFSLETWNFLL
jgi:hypothetical protein